MRSFSKLFSILSSVILFGTLALLLSDCFLKQDRTTTIYGTITDQNGQPVDSILVLVQGVVDFKYESLLDVYSDSNGNYEFVMDVPKGYSSVNIAIPFSNSRNPKFSKNFIGNLVKRMKSRPATAALLQSEKKPNTTFN